MAGAGDSFPLSTTDGSVLGKVLKCSGSVG